MFKEVERSESILDSLLDRLLIVMVIGVMILIILIIVRLSGKTPTNTLSIIFSGIVAFATIIYAYYTKRLVVETIKLRKAQTEPEISLVSSFKNDKIELTVENIGLGPAQNVKLSILEFYKKTRPDESADEHPTITEITVKEIPCLYPSQKHTILLDSSKKDNVGTWQMIKISYDNSLGEKRISREFIPPVDALQAFNDYTKGF
jgi:hypothetical protein